MRILLALAITAFFLPVTAEAQDMSFFVTSQGAGNGADLGGLDGADAHCQMLATEAGGGDRMWRAYLSNDADDFGSRVSARLRIGGGPWYNAHGVLIAADADELHLYNRTITRATAVDENGNQIPGGEHDILTGSMEDGMAFFPDDEDHTCNNWTSSDEGSASIGHSDRFGGGNPSWNQAHTTNGCSQEGLQSTGGAGRLYCFAAD